MMLAASNYQHIWATNGIVAKNLAYQRAEIKGEVLSVPNCQAVQCQFIFRIHQLNQQKLSSPISVKLYWQNDEREVKQGQHWQFLAKIKPAHGYANLHGVHYQAIMRYQGNHATGYVKSASYNTLLSDNQTLRQRWLDRFRLVIADYKLAPIVEALTFGERGRLSDWQWQVLNKTQIQHLISISGLHVGLVTMFAYGLLVAFVKVLPLSYLNSKFGSVGKRQRYLQLNARQYLLILSALIAWFYGYLAGFSIPTMRAIVAISVLLLIRLFGLTLTPLRLFLLCIALIVWIQPLSVLSVSFWLSFYAVASLLVLSWQYPQLFATTQEHRFNSIGYVWHYLKLLLLVQIALTLLMLPLVILVSGQISLVAVIANLVAVPVVSFVILPLSLLTLLLSVVSEQVASAATTLTFWLLDTLWIVLSYLANLPWASITLNVAAVPVVIALAAVLFSVCFCKRLLARRLVISISCALALYTYRQQTTEEEWQLIVFDVGQGLAVAVKQGEHYLLYDTGASYHYGSSVADSVLVPFFTKTGSKELDWLFISHDDNDHAGGYQTLLKQLLVKRVVQNFDVHSATDNCLAGQQFQWRKLSIQILSPWQVRGSDNQDSCVIRISDGRHSLLLTGDIDRATESRLIKQTTQDPNFLLAADVLIAPHHGSKTSSSEAFIQAVSPKITIFSAGFLHYWKMPNSHVVKRYRQQGVKTYNTAEHGMLMISFKADELLVTRYRQDYFWFWFAN